MYFECASILPTCKYVCLVSAMPTEATGGARSAKTGVTDSCDPSRGC